MLLVSGPTINSTNLELAALADAKAYTQQTSTANDTLLQKLLDYSHWSLYEFLGQRVIKKIDTNWVYILDGTGTDRIYMPQWPVDLSTLSIDYGYISDSTPTFTSNSSLTTGDFYVNEENGYIDSLTWGWIKGKSNYRFTFKAGYTTAPPDLVEAICQWVSVKLLRLQQKRWDIQAQTKESMSQVFREQEIPESAMRVFMRYKRLEVGIAVS